MAAPPRYAESCRENRAEAKKYISSETASTQAQAPLRPIEVNVEVRAVSADERADSHGGISVLAHASPLGREGVKQTFFGGLGGAETQVQCSGMPHPEPWAK
jgi:hypothetical protein